MNKPCETAYTVQALARLTGASVGQLRRWARSGLLPADHRLGTSLRYRFADVIAARAARTLLQQGVTTRNVREAVEAIRAWRPDVPNPLASLRLFAESGRLVVRIDDRLVDSRSGQLLLDLPLAEGPVAAAVHTLVPAAPRDADAWIAWAQEAERAGTPADIIGGRFRRALELDPLHPGALIGLGNVEYARGRWLKHAPFTSAPLRSPASTRTLGTIWPMCSTSSATSTQPPAPTPPRSRWIRDSATHTSTWRFYGKSTASEIAREPTGSR